MTLVGANVVGLLHLLHAGGLKSLRAELRRPGSAPITATLSHLNASGQRQATAKLTVDRPPTAGKYTGSLSVYPFAADAPTWSITIDARRWVLFAVLTIFAGVLASGYITQQFSLTRRQRLLKSMLKDIVDEYLTTRAADPNVPMWSLPGIEHAVKLNPDWKPYSNLDTADNVYTAVRWARNTTDLDEAQAVALTMMTSLKSWQLAFAAMQQLCSLARNTRRAAADWMTTQCSQDTRLLMLKAQHPPETDTADSFTHMVLRQAGWHGRYALAWDLRDTLVSGGGQVAVDAAKVDLIKLDSDAPGIEKRTSDEQDELDLKLDGFNQELLALRDRAAPADRAPLPQLPEEVRELQITAAAFAADVRVLTTPNETATLALTQLGARKALSQPRANADGTGAPAGAIQPTGGVSVGQGGAAAPDADSPGLAVAASSSRPTGRGHPSADDGDLTGWRGVIDAVRRPRYRFLLTDWLLSLAVIIVTVGVYTPTVYNDTWGTVSDFATAFGAGFLGHVVIKWALLPIYQSLRIRATPQATTQAAAPPSPVS